MPRFLEKEVRVRLTETDALGVVYYGHYYTYFDLCRLELLRELGITLRSLKKRDLGFVAARSSCRYHSSASFDDLLTLRVGVVSVGRTSVTYGHDIRKGRTKIAEGEVVDVMVNPKGKPVPIPADIRRQLARFQQ